MEKKNEIQVYVNPNNLKVVWAFTLKNFISYDVDDLIADTEISIEYRDLSEQNGQEYEIQKNRMNR